MKLNHHGLILGAVQTGKTTTAIRLLQKQDGLLIFVNSKLDRNFDRNYYSFINQYTIEQMLWDYKNGYAKAGYIYCFDVDIDEKGYKDVILLAENLLKWHQKGLIDRTVIMIDEMHLYKKKIEPIEKLWTMGLGLGIRAVGISQRIQGVNLNIRENSEVFVLHALQDTQMEFLETSGLIKIHDSFKDGEYMYRYKLWQHSANQIDHSCYIQTDPNGLRRWF